MKTIPEENELADQITTLEKLIDLLRPFSEADRKRMVQTALVFLSE